MNAAHSSAAAHQVFLPYAYREKPPHDRRWFCEDLCANLSHLGLRMKIDARLGRRLGIIVASTRVTAPDELQSAVVPHLPHGMFDLAASAAA